MSAVDDLLYAAAASCLCITVYCPSVCSTLYGCVNLCVLGMRTVIQQYVLRCLVCLTGTLCSIVSVLSCMAACYVVADCQLWYEIKELLIIRPCRSRSAAAYSHQTFP